MIVVSDTSPLNYLLLIGQEAALRALFGRVLIPPKVLAELADQRAPELVRIWASRPPAWVEVRAPASEARDRSLDQGEAEAIALALEVRADALLIDERDGRIAAERSGLIAIGLVAVLEIAAASGLVDLRDAIAKLQTTELLGRTTDECLQLFGGWGYMWEMPIARAYADARMARLAAGTSEVIRQIIARSILPRK